MDTEFNWGPHGEAWWRALAKEAGCSSELCLKWLVAKMVLDCTNTEAARRAEAKGGATAAGYRLSRSRDTERLRMAYALKTGGDEALGNVDGIEARRILSRLARGSDPQIKIRALETLARLDAQARETGQSEADDGMAQDRLARDLMIANEDGAASFMLMLSGQHLALSCMPLFHDLVQRVRGRWPQIWDVLLARQSATMRQDLEKKLADRNWQLWGRQKIWGEIGHVIDATDNAAKPDLQRRSFIMPTATRPGQGNANGSGAIERGSTEAETKQTPAA